MQRLEKNEKSRYYDGDISNKTNILPPYSQPAFSTNNILQQDNNVKLILNKVLLFYLIICYNYIK